jgi:hypothetical protein
MFLGRAWRWFATNVRAQPHHERLPLELERNREAATELGAQNPPDLPLYTFRLGLRAGFSGDQLAGIPVFKRVNPHPHPVLKEIFYCEVAGQVLEAANVHALQAKVSRMLETLAPARSLPLAYFHVPAVDYSLPIYEDDGEIVSPVIAGPKLKARDLATMRQHVCRYLANAGYVTEDSQVEIRVLRPSDLKLVPPAALIGSLDNPDLWFATVEGRSAEGLVIGLLGEATELKPDERPRAGGPSPSAPPAASDIASLLRLIAGELIEADRLADPYALFATHVRPEIWARTEQLSDDIGRKLVCWLEDTEPVRLELPLRRSAAGELVTALDHQGICVFVALDEADLGRKVGRYLTGHGFLRWEDAVEVEGEQPIHGSPDGADDPDRVVAREEISFSRLEWGSPPPDTAHPETEESFDKQEHEEEVGLP